MTTFATLQDTRERAKMNRVGLANLVSSPLPLMTWVWKASAKTVQIPLMQCLIQGVEERTPVDGARIGRRDLLNAT